MSSVFEFNLNGVMQQVDVDPQTPLLYVLRNTLAQTGTRFGCGTGNCGACTVLINGRVVQSCDISLEAVAGQPILTVEGLDTDRVGRLVRDAFIQEQAAQCGYCINGILMSVTALLTLEAEPDRASINAALNRHLCRCGTHVRILRAVELAIATLKKYSLP
jgi:nicotinate dehydrogenase subunit A